MACPPFTVCPPLSCPWDRAVVTGILTGTVVKGYGCWLAAHRQSSLRTTYVTAVTNYELIGMVVLGLLTGTLMYGFFLSTMVSKHNVVKLWCSLRAADKLSSVKSMLLTGTLVSNCCWWQIRAFGVRSGLMTGTDMGLKGWKAHFFQGRFHYRQSGQGC